MSNPSSIVAALDTSGRAVVYAWKHSPHYTKGAIISGTVVALVPAAQVEVMKYLIGSLSPGTSPAAPIVLAALAAVVISLTMNINRHVVQLSQLDLRRSYSSDLTRLITRLSPPETVDNRLVERIRAARDAVPFNLAWQATSFYAVLTAFFAVFFLMLSLWSISPLASLFVALVMVPDLVVYSRLARVENEIWPQAAAVNRRQEYLHAQVNFQPASTEIAANGHGDSFNGELRELYRDEFDVFAKAPRSGIRLQFFSSLAVLVLAAGAFAAIVLAESATSATLGAGVVGVMSCLLVTRGAGAAYGELMASAPLIQQYESLVVDLGAREGEADVMPSGPAAIDASGVSFRYPGANDAAIADADLRIEPGEFVAFVGANGSGKTTCAKLLGGILEADSGTITIGEDSDAASRRARTAMVFQDFTRFEVTVRRFVDPLLRRSDDQIEAALRAAQAWSYVAPLPGGIDAQLGPQWDGAGLSGGQWQRLALARVLLSDKDVWILDEPTAAVDAEAEAAIYQQLAELKGTRTVIVISHRPETLKAVDRVVGFPLGRGQ